MKRALINFVKYNTLVYRLYYLVGTFLIKALKLFIKPRPNLILFNSFGGRKYDDSPRAIYEQMLSDSRFDGMDFVWAFLDPDNQTIPQGSKIASDTFRYYVTALQARVWISNSSIERGLSFKGKKTFFLNTWHGTPIKKMGGDISKTNKSFKSKGHSAVDLMTAQGEFEADIFSRVFGIPRKNFRIIGLPRNDALANHTQEQRNAIRRKLGIGDGKTAIVYAPTFREYNQSARGVEISLPADLEKWKKRLGSSYALLFRAHYEVVNALDINEDDFCRNVSDYPSLNDLMIASDMLISDYSSIFFDYSILNKPMICYAYDYEEYATHRGVYFDIRGQLPSASNEEELLSLIMHLDYSVAMHKTAVFREKYVTAYGTATQQSLDIIAKELNL